MISDEAQCTSINLVLNKFIDVRFVAEIHQEVTDVFNTPFVERNAIWVCVDCRGRQREREIGGDGG